MTKTPDSTFYIRYATVSDATLLAEIGAETFYDSFAADNTPEDMASYLAESFGPAKQANELADPSSKFLIAEAEGIPIGYARLKFQAAPGEIGGKKPMEIARFYARKPWIGKGAGAQLMQACLDEAQRAGCDVVWLDVWERNLRAIAFYQKWGFTQVGTQLFQLGNDLQHDWLMAKPLKQKAEQDEHANRESDSGTQIAYWNKVAQAKTFSLPVNLPLLHTYLPLESKILDYGCGYGRVCQQLAEFGFSGTAGIDSSPEMIRRAQQMHPTLRFDVGTAADLPYAAGTFDAIMLIAVLTCIPTNADQQRLIATLGQFLRTGGILYVADYVLQTDERNQSRYARDTNEFGIYGVFRSEEGGIFRHHDMEWVKTLLADFTAVDISFVDVLTMNGHPAKAFQYCCRKDR